MPSPLEQPSTAFYPFLLDQHHLMQAQKTQGMWEADTFFMQGLFYWCAPADAKDSKRSLIAAGFRSLHSS
jgi:hypothetical protein